jgi:HEAT repeat protein
MAALLKRGPTAMQTIRLGLRSTTRQVRDHAARIATREELGAAGERCQSLVDSLPDTPDAIRGETYAALGRIRHGCAVPILRRVVIDPHTDSRNRLYAANALGSLGRSESVPELIIALNDPIMAVQSAAALNLGRVGDPSAVDPLLQRALVVVTAPSVRAACAKALGQLENSRALSPLAILMHHKVVIVRQAATRALGMLNNTTVVPLLIQRTQDKTLLKTAINSLVSLGDSRAIPALGLIAKKSAHSVELRKHALWALGQWSNPEVFQVIGSLLQADEPTIVTATVTALGRARATAAVDALIPLLNAPNNDLAQTTLWALQTITGKEYGPDRGAWEFWRQSSP